MNDTVRPYQVAWRALARSFVAAWAAVLLAVAQEAGAQTPEIQVSPLTLPFGNRPIGTTGAMTVTVSNTGSGDLSFAASESATDFSLSSAQCSLGGAVLAPGASCEISVSFTPQALGLRSGTLVIDSTDADESQVNVALSGTGVPRTRGDFNADGRADVLWRHAATGETYLYPMNGTAILGTEGYVRTVADLNWKIAGVGDFDGDGKADVLWRNAATGENYVYFMDGTTIKPTEGYLRTEADLNMQVAGIGDFNGDGTDDILWRNSSTGENYLYPMSGLTILGTEGNVRTVADQNWQVAGVGDFDGDGMADILWRNSATGENYLYPMNGTAIKPEEGFLRAVPDQSWRIVGIGDFNGDGRADILWRNASTGENYLYPMNGTSILGTEGYLRTVAALDWQVAGVGDYDGDGKADILWRNSASGEDYVYPMNGTTILGTEGYLRTVADQGWHPAGAPEYHAIDSVRVACDGGLASDSSDAAHYARAIDLCRTTTENPPRAGRGWGLISAELVLADGTGAPHASSRAIRASFGSASVPGFGSAMSVLSTGHAAAADQTSPPFAAFQLGANLGTQSGFPADWLAANGSVLPTAPGCPALGGVIARDPVMLKLRIRVPSNARSFSVAARLFAADYPEYVCSPYNDFFVALLQSGYAGAPANPADKNLAIGANGTPVGVNLVNSDLFTSCLNGSIGCAAGAVAGFASGCVGVADLAGTGFDTLNPEGGAGGGVGYCGTNNLLGGGTPWFDLRGNVIPGETIELRFALWDTDDGSFDTVVLLDDFRWSKELVQPGTVPR